MKRQKIPTSKLINQIQRSKIKNQDEVKWVENYANHDGPRDELNKYDSVSIQMLKNEIMKDLNPALPHLDSSLPYVEPVSVSSVLGYWPKLKYCLTLCTVIQNDIPYIVQWVEFCVQVYRVWTGYDDSFAYNAHVYLINAPNVSKFKLLNHAVADYFQKYGNNTKWMTIADTDEFIHSVLLHHQELDGAIVNSIVEQNSCIEP